MDDHSGNVQPAANGTEADVDQDGEKLMPRLHRLSASYHGNAPYRPVHTEDTPIQDQEDD